MIRYNNGDIREAKSGYILSGCNSRNSNGSGLAKSLANKWPNVKEAYHLFYAEKGYLNLGEFKIVGVDEDLFVVNIITQDNYGYDGAEYVSYAGIEVGLHSLVGFINRNGLEKTIHAPQIGCGLAGGDWGIVQDIFFKIVPDSFDLNFWIYK